jgi:CheY-like chemotaxis protein
VLANEGQLGQVFLNLLVNAAQSIPEGAAAHNEIRITTRADREGSVVIEIRDTGIGFSQEVGAHIFEPFFTTKPIGLGTGLGLSICHGIVTSHGGRIEAESTVGRGSVFRVVLPGCGTPAPTRSSRPPRPGERPTGRFLIVDDEALIARTYCRLLGEDQCVTCLSGTDALALLQRGELFDAIVCDLMMPETSGIDVYDMLLRVAPEQAKRVIFVTGGAFTDRARRFLDEVTNPVIEKPLDTARLYDCVSRLLEKTKPR